MSNIGDELLEAFGRAAEDLPLGWSVGITVVPGAGWVWLQRGMEDTDWEPEAGESFACQVHDAINYARDQEPAQPARPSNS